MASCFSAPPTAISLVLLEGDALTRGRTPNAKKQALRAPLPPPVVSDEPAAAIKQRRKKPTSPRRSTSPPPPEPEEPPAPLPIIVGSGVPPKVCRVVFLRVCASVFLLSLSVCQSVSLARSPSVRARARARVCVCVCVCPCLCPTLVSRCCCCRCHRFTCHNSSQLGLHSLACTATGSRPATRAGDAGAATYRVR